MFGGHPAGTYMNSLRYSQFLFCPLQAERSKHVHQTLQLSYQCWQAVFRPDVLCEDQFFQTGNTISLWSRLCVKWQSVMLPNSNSTKVCCASRQGAGCLRHLLFHEALANDSNPVWDLLIRPFARSPSFFFLFLASFVNLFCWSISVLMSVELFCCQLAKLRYSQQAFPAPCLKAQRDIMGQRMNATSLLTTCRVSVQTFKEANCQGLCQKH